jgi:hypothetical protein
MLLRKCIIFGDDKIVNTILVYETKQQNFLRNDYCHILQDFFINQ